MKTLLCTLTVLFLSGCSLLPPGAQFTAHRENLQFREDQAQRREKSQIRADFLEFNTAQEKQLTARAAINAKSTITREMEIPTDYTIPPSCEEESAKIPPEVEEICNEIRKMHDDFLKKFGKPRNKTVDIPPSGVVDFTAATIYGGVNVFSTGATAEGARRGEQKMRKPLTPPISLGVPKSDFQSFSEGFFSFLGQGVKAISDNTGSIGLGLGLIESLKNPSSYIGGDDIGGNDNTARGDYVRVTPITPEAGGIIE